MELGGNVLISSLIAGPRSNKCLMAISNPYTPPRFHRFNVTGGLPGPAHWRLLLLVEASCASGGYLCQWRLPMPVKRNGPVEVLVPVEIIFASGGYQYYWRLSVPVEATCMCQ
jgi:hypothetical protein